MKNRFLKNPDYNIEHRNNIANVLLVLLKSANESHVVAYFERNLCYILGYISNIGELEMASTEDLHMMANCLLFMQAYYKWISKEAVDTNGPLDHIWTKCDANKDKKPVNTHILRAYKNLILETNHNLATLAPERRDAVLACNREAFNTFATYTLQLSDKVQLYNSFFRKEVKSGKYIWTELVDPAQQIYLEIQLSQPLVKKRLEMHSISSGKSKSDGSKLYYMDSIDIMGSR